MKYIKIIKVLEIFIRLLCSILFILSIPLIIIQLIYYGLKFIIIGNCNINSPLPFIIVDNIMNWYYNKYLYA